MEPSQVTVLVIRHGIRFPKRVPAGWPLHDEVAKEGSLTEKGGIN